MAVKRKREGGGEEGEKKNSNRKHRTYFCYFINNIPIKHLMVDEKREEIYITEDVPLMEDDAEGK